MAVIGRHIRHDWEKWTDNQDQSTVRTLCGVTTKPHLAGIPNVGDHSSYLVNKDTGWLRWAWCGSCCEIMYRRFDVNDYLPNGVSPLVAPLYHRMKAFTKEWEVHR